MAYNEPQWTGRSEPERLLAIRAEGALTHAEKWRDKVKAARDHKEAEYEDEFSVRLQEQADIAGADASVRIIGYRTTAQRAIHGTRLNVLWIELERLRRMATKMDTIVGHLDRYNWNVTKRIVTSVGKPRQK